MRITVYDILEYLASGMTTAEILSDFPELTETDIPIQTISETQLPTLEELGFI